MNARIETIPGEVLATDLPGAEHPDHGDTIGRAVELAAEHGGQVLLLDEEGATTVYDDGHMEDFGS